MVNGPALSRVFNIWKWKRNENKNENQNENNKFECLNLKMYLHKAEVMRQPK